LYTILILPLPLPWKFGGGLKIGKAKAHIALDMRIVRVKDAEILSAKTVKGKSERWKFGAAAGGLFGSTVGGGWFEAFKNTLRRGNQRPYSTSSNLNCK
jgi:curli biogenesis system outer membrane secretion channel CsgG